MAKMITGRYTRIQHILRTIKNLSCLALNDLHKPFDPLRFVFKQRKFPVEILPCEVAALDGAVYRVRRDFEMHAPCICGVISTLF